MSDDAHAGHNHDVAVLERCTARRPHRGRRALTCPSESSSNADLEKLFDTSDEWIQTSRTRDEASVACIRGPDEATSDIALGGAHAARSPTRRMDPATILSCIIVATVTPDYMRFRRRPACVGSKAGRRPASAAFDMEIALQRLHLRISRSPRAWSAAEPLPARAAHRSRRAHQRYVNYTDRSTADALRRRCRCSGRLRGDRASIRSWEPELGCRRFRIPKTLYLPAERHRVSRRSTAGRYWPNKRWNNRFR